MAYKNNKHINILQSIKPMSRSPQFYLLSGFILGAVSVASILLGYSYYQNSKGLTGTPIIAENHQITDSNHAVESEQLIQKAATLSNQEDIQNPEDGFDQNIENMFKVAKSESHAEPDKHTSPFESAFDVQAQKPLIQANDKNKPLKPVIHTIKSPSTKTKEIKEFRYNSLNVKANSQSTIQTEKPVELKTASTSSQEQPPATTPQESAEVEPS